MDKIINIVCRPKRLAPGGWLDHQKSGGKYKILSLYTSANDTTHGRLYVCTMKLIYVAQYQPMKNTARLCTVDMSVVYIHIDARGLLLLC